MAFYMVGKFKSFSKAAIELAITQAAVSRQIKLLESSIGEDLFFRSSKSVELTTRGRALHNIVDKFIFDYKNNFEKQKIKKIRIGCIEGVLSKNLLNIIEKFKKKYNVGVEIKINKTGILIKSLELNELDFVISNNETQKGHLTSLEILNESFVFISKKSISLNKLSNEKLILYSENDEMKKYVKNFNYIIINSFKSIIHYVEKHNYVALVPEHLIQDNHSFIRTPYKKKSSKLFITGHAYEKSPIEFKDFIKMIQKCY